MKCCGHLNIETTLDISSLVEDGRSDLRNTDRVIDICKRTGATTYINPPGGGDLYSPSEFAAQGLELRFLKPRLAPYPQFGDTFVPSLSILDVMMFNTRDSIADQLQGEYELVE